MIKTKLTLAALVILTIFISCKKQDEAVTAANAKYKIEYLKGMDHSDTSKVSRELYISHKDTVFNQELHIKNGTTDYSKSLFYKLKVTETGNPNEYSGELALYSSLKNIRKIEFEYTEIKSGKTVTSKLTADSANAIRFKFHNENSNQLSGILKFSGDIVEKDGNETILIPSDEYLLVDNSKTTDNLFLEKFGLLQKKRLNN